MAGYRHGLTRAPVVEGAGNSHESMQQHLPLSAVSNQHQSMVSGTFSDSKRPDELATVTADWHDQAYQRIVEVKRKFGPKLQILHKLFTSFCNKPASAENIQGYKSKLEVIEKQMMFLSMERCQITKFSKEDVNQYLEFIVRIVTSCEKKISASVRRNSHQKPGTQSQSSQKPQNLNVKQQFNPVSLALTSGASSSSPGSIMQPEPSTSQPENLFGPIQGSTRAVLEQRDKLPGNTIRNVNDLEPKHPTMLPQEPKAHMQMPISCLHPFGQQADVSEVHQPKVIGAQSNVLNMQLHQPTAGVLQQSVAMISEQNVRNATQPVQFHQNQSSQKQQSLSRKGIQQHLQISAVSNQHRSTPDSAVDQQKQFHSHSMFSGASLESKTPDEIATAVDGLDQAYQRILEVKRKFGPKLQYLHKQFTSFCNKPASAGEIEDYKNKLKLMEKQMAFLSLQRCQITNLSKEKVDRYLEFIIKFISSFLKNFPAADERNSLHQCGIQSQSSQKPQNLNVRQQSLPVNLALRSSMGSSSPGSVMQPEPPNSQPKNLFSPLQCSSRMGLEQRDELRQHSASSVGENDLGGRWDKLSGNTIVDVSYSKPAHPTMLPTQPKQQMQLHNMQQEKKHMEPGIALGIKCAENQNQTLQLKNRQLCATSQNARQSSPEIGQSTSLPHLPKAKTSLQSANSPSVIASSSPLAPSAVLPDHGGHRASVDSPSGNKGCLEALGGADTQSQVQPTSPAVTSDTVASPPITSSTTSDGNQQSDDAMQPFERLLKAIKSSSPEALSAAVYEIELAVNEADTIADTTTTDSLLDVGEDFVSTTTCGFQALNFCADDAGFHMSGTKRQISALASSLTDSLINSESNIFQFDSTAMPGNKRRRIEPSNDLFDEIRRINQKLIETVVEFDSTKDALALTEGNEGTIVRCSYSAVAVNENFKAYASTLNLPVLSIWLLVPASYPNSSPEVLEDSSLGWSLCNEHCEDLSDKAKLRFSTYLRKLSEPVSVGEMAKTWDVCARAMVFEQAQQVGGECFSSRYGTWESFIVA